MWKLRIAVDNGSSMLWVNTPYKNLSEAERYVRNIYSDAVVLNQEYEVRDD